MQTRERFDEGRAAYVRGDFAASNRIFTELARGGSDRSATYFRDRAAAMASSTAIVEWDGIEHMEHK